MLPIFKIRRLYANDIFNLNLTNLDASTENYTFDYYMYYLLNHSEDCICVEMDGDVVAYLLGKHETRNKVFSAHVSALTVAPVYRKTGIGKTLMNFFRDNAEAKGAEFIDLYVRKSNVAFNFYTNLGYVINEEILNYYSEPEENAYDMRLYLNKKQQDNK